MGNLSAHFDSSEFRCKCGCGKCNPSQLLITRLEKLHTLMHAKSIIINSGYRCPNYSVRVGGSAMDAHTRNIAADIVVKKQDGTLYTADDIAEAAERIGFGGIGLMNNACHVDTRDSETYANKHWFGDERDGRNYIKTFQRGTVFPGETKPESQPQKKTMKVTVEYDDHTYSGLLEEGSF